MSDDTLFHSMDDEDLDDPFFISGRPSITNGLRFPGDGGLSSSPHPDHQMTSTRSGENRRWTHTSIDQDQGSNDGATPTRSCRAVSHPTRTQVNHLRDEVNTLTQSSSKAADAMRISVSPPFGEYTLNQQDEAWMSSPRGSGAESQTPESPRRGTIDRLSLIRSPDLLFDPLQTDLQDQHDRSPSHSRSPTIPQTSSSRRATLPATAVEDVSSLTASTQRANRDLIGGFRESSPSVISRESSKTVRAINAKSDTRRRVQIKLLVEVNVYLGTLAEAWLKYVHDLNETAGLDEGYNGNDQWPAISKQWTDTWIHVKETNQKLEGIRDRKSSGTPWHNHNGIYYDLPLSWFNYRHRLLSPSRVADMSSPARSNAVELMKILEALLVKAAGYHAESRKHPVTHSARFAREVGIPDMKWRGKLGSIDVIGYP